MKKLFLLLILSFFSAQGLAGGCPDGSEPVKTVSADGTYFVYKCNADSNNTKESKTSPTTTSSESTTTTVSTDKILDVQVMLSDLGYKVGSVDGKLNDKTLQCLKDFRKDQNLPSGDGLMSSDIENLRMQYTKSPIDIPIFENYGLELTQNNVLITDTSKYKYSSCQDVINEHLTTHPISGNQIFEKYGHLAIPDLNQAISNWDPNVGTAEEITSHMGRWIYKTHHACLSGVDASCKQLRRLVEHFSDNRSFTRNVSHANNPEIYYVTINRFISPLLIGYTTSNQVLGKHDRHLEIGAWFKDAIYQNTYHPFPYKMAKVRDMERQKLRCEQKKTAGRSHHAQNHSLQSSLLVMMYGVIWNDDHAFNIGVDSFYQTLDSVNNEGALPCEAVRGSSALWYSGGTISTLIQIYDVALANDIRLEEVKSIDNLHRTVKFQLDAGLDPKLIYKYAKSNNGPMCGENYKNQCHMSGFTGTGYEWIKRYVQLFPNHQNTKRINGLADQMANSDNLDLKTRTSLSGMFYGVYPIPFYKKNIVWSSEQEKGWYSNAYIFDTYGEWQRGSPMCLYDTANIQETTKTDETTSIEASDVFDGRYSFDISRYSEDEDELLLLGEGYIEIRNGIMTIAKKGRTLDTGSEDSYDSFKGHIDTDGNIDSSLRIPILWFEGHENYNEGTMQKNLVDLSGNIDGQLQGNWDHYLDVILELGEKDFTDETAETTKTAETPKVVTSDDDPTVSKVIEVIHGDTFIVDIAEPHELAGSNIKLIIRDANTPDATKSCPRQMEFGIKVKDNVTQKLNDASSIKLKNYRKTSTAVIAQVIVDGKDLGEELIAKGYASNEYGHWKAYFCSALQAMAAGDSNWKYGTADVDKAIFWYERAIVLDPNRDQKLVFYDLSELYKINGDTKKSIDYLKQSAKLGHMEAEEALGAAYMNGNGVSKDPTKAKKWLKKAHDNGSDSAEDICGCEF
jgi:endonuclease YncB( thermonuclease family)